MEPYCPYMGRKGKSWGELELQTIAGRVAQIPKEVLEAARKMAEACKVAGIPVERAKVLLEEAFGPAVSEPASKRSRR